MKITSSFTSAVLVAAALGASTSYAQLELSGYAHGIFIATGAGTSLLNDIPVTPFSVDDPAQPGGAADYLASYLFTGAGSAGAATTVKVKNPVTPHSVIGTYAAPTLVTFNNDPFYEVVSGGTMSLGSLEFANWLTNSGTAVSSFSLSLYLDLQASNGATLDDFFVGTLQFGLTSTGSVSTTSNAVRSTDVFQLVSATFAPELTTGVLLGDYLATFEFSFSQRTSDTLLSPAGLSVGSKQTIGGGTMDLFVNLTEVQDSPAPVPGAVPEPSTYGVMGAGLLVVLAAARRRQRR